MYDICALGEILIDAIASADTSIQITGNAGGAPHEREAYQWIHSIIDDKDPCVLPEQAYVVTQILEGIYESAKTGDIVFLNK